MWFLCELCAYVVQNDFLEWTQLYKINHYKMEKKVIVITGGSSGIGLQTISQLSDNENIHVISFSRSEDKIKTALKETGNRKNVTYVRGDVTSIDDCQKLAEQINREHAKLHGLVNNAGVLTKGGMEDIDYEKWKYNLEINLNGVYLLTRSLLPMLKKANGASIVNVSSIAALKPGSSVAYSVSKAGLDMLTEFLAGDLAPYNIRVNSVNPGLVRTPIHINNKIFENIEDYEKLLKNAVGRYPVNRVGEPEDIANLIEFLLSDKSSWITGSIMKIDGGAMIYNDLIPPKGQK